MLKPGTIVELTENTTVTRGVVRRRHTFAAGTQFAFLRRDRLNGLAIVRDAAGVRWSLPADRLEAVAVESEPATPQLPGLADDEAA